MRYSDARCSSQCFTGSTSEVRLIKYILSLRIVHLAVRSGQCPRPDLSRLSGHWSHGKLLANCWPKSHLLSHTCIDSDSGLVARDEETSSAIFFLIRFSVRLVIQPGQPLASRRRVTASHRTGGPNLKQARSNLAPYTYQSLSQALHFLTVPKREESTITHFSHLSRQQGPLPDKIA